MKEIVSVFSKDRLIEPISSDSNYLQKWIRELSNLSFKSKAGVSFVLPLLLIPMAVEGISSIAKAIKEKKEEKK